MNQKMRALKKDDLNFRASGRRAFFLQALAPFIPAALSFATSFLGKKKGGDQQAVQVPGQTVQGVPDYVIGAGEHLTDWAHKYLDQFVPGAAYGGQLSAEMSPFEGAGLGFLTQFLQQPMSESFTAGKGELLKTLGGEYDPVNSPFFKSMRNQAMLNQQDAIDATNRQAAAGGNFYSDARVRDIGKDITGRTATYLDSILGGMFEDERNRMTDASKLALPYAEAEQGFALDKANAAVTIGSLPRILQQSALERNYNEFTRQRDEMKMPVDALQRVATGSAGVRETYTPSTTMYTPSIMDRTSMALGGILKSAPQFFQNMIQQIPGIGGGGIPIGGGNSTYASGSAPVGFPSQGTGGFLQNVLKSIFNF